MNKMVKTKQAKLASSVALVVGFTLAVGTSINNYAAAFAIVLPIAIALYVNKAHYEN